MAGVLWVGCGGVAPEEESALETRSDAALECTSEYIIDYYNEPELITWVGTENCYCGGLQYRSGRRTAYYVKTVYTPICSWPAQ